MKSKILILIVLVVLLFAAVAVRNSLQVYTDRPAQGTETPSPSDPDGGMIACTMDAMMCPDGSYVGRTGPNCQFVCPEITTLRTEIFQKKLNETTTMGDKVMRFVEVIEDSRCPVDVVCIQAGTLRVKALVGTTEYIFVLGVPIAFGDTVTLELLGATPEPRASSPIKKEDYKFTFRMNESIPQPI